MSVRRRTAAAAAIGFVPLVLTGLAATPASAHGSMQNPVSRVSACYAEGPEHPRSAACKAAVAAGGTQALYDWMGVRDGEAGGKSRQRIPDGQLCSGGNAEFKGLDLARADWPATRMSGGSYTFSYRATAPHRGSFALYITKAGYDPAKPLKWADLEATPFLTVTDPTLAGGSYVFSGKVPQRSGRHLIYSIWQRSDSPEAFYTCSDVVFGNGAGSSSSSQAPSSSTASAPTASATSEQQIAAGAGKSTVQHDHGQEHSAATTAAVEDANTPRANGSATPLAGRNLAETGTAGNTVPLTIGGAAFTALGASVLLLVLRRRAGTAGRRRA